MTDRPIPPFEPLADLARALGSAHRLALLDLVAREELAVERLAEATGLSVANASQHLQHLRRAGVVQTRRDGKRVLYRLGDAPVADVVAALRRCVEHQHAQIRELVADSVEHRERLDAMSRDELLARMHDDTVTLLDVRPRDEFAQGHLPGAINIPLAELERRLAELPPDHDVVAYCRGPYCVLSTDAVVLLRAKGLRARHYDNGFPEWKAAGLRVETGG